MTLMEWEKIGTQEWYIQICVLIGALAIMLYFIYLRKQDKKQRMSNLEMLKREGKMPLENSTENRWISLL